MFKTLEHGHTGDTYILWLNSLYYGYNGWYNTDIVPESIPDNITTLGFGCFKNNSGLKTIDIPKNIKFISSDCFCSCPNLNKVVISSNDVKLAGTSFSNCTGMTSVTILCDLQTVGLYMDNSSWYSCFRDCTNINTIHYTYGRTGVMVDSDSDKSLARQAGESLRTVIFDDEITHIGKYSFNYLTSLSSVSLPSKLKSIGECAFRMCTSLKKIELPDSLETVGDYAFSNNSSLGKIMFPSQIKALGNNSFSNCTNLTELYIPKSITNIDSYAFHSCDKLKTVTYNGYKQDWDKISIDSLNDPLENVTFNPCEHEYSSKIITPATCTTDGEKENTSSKCGDSYNERIKALGHNWSTPTYEWSVDEKVCTATCVCKNDKVHTETETINIVSNVKSPSTCTAKGTTTYTARFNNKIFATQTKDV